MMMKLKKEEGFTLIEILIVVAIIGVLAAIAIPKFVNMTKEAQIKACHSNIASLATAVEMYNTIKGEYPENLVDMRDVSLKGDAQIKDCPVTSDAGGEPVYTKATGEVHCENHGGADGE